MELPLEIYREILKSIGWSRPFPKSSECKLKQPDEYEMFRDKIIRKLLEDGRVYASRDVKIDSNFGEFCEKIAKEARAHGWSVYIDDEVEKRPRPPKPPIAVIEDLDTPPLPPGAFIVRGGIGIRRFPLSEGYREAKLCIVPKEDWL